MQTFETLLKCPVCGNENGPLAHFCTRCGERIEYRCPRCQSVLSGVDHFCNGCGAAGPASYSAEYPPAESRSLVYNPFRHVRARTLVIWALLSIPPAVVMFFLIEALLGENADDPAVALLAQDVWVYGAMSSWMLWQVVRNRIKIRHFMGRVPKGFNWFSVLGIAAASFLFSLGCLVIITYVMSLAGPGFQGYLDERGIDPTAESVTPVLFIVLSALSLTVLAPVIEEAAFRGLLMHRWAVKWSPGVALIATSLVFGILHDVNVIGATVFGMVAGLLYYKTRTLIVPMVAHFLNNAVVFGLTFLVQGMSSGSDAPPTTPANETSALQLGIVLVAVTGPILFIYARRNWPKRNELLPYFHNEPVERTPALALDDR